MSVSVRVGFTVAGMYETQCVPYALSVVQAGTMAVQEAQMILGVEQNAPWGDVVKVRGVQRGWQLRVLTIWGGARSRCDGGGTCSKKGRSGVESRGCAWQVLLRLKVLEVSQAIVYM